MDINNIFDFIDELQRLNPVSGTANENRAFIFNTLPLGENATDDPADLLTAYREVGISVPDSVFNDIFDLVASKAPDGAVIQTFAPTSMIPGPDLPLFVPNKGTGELEQAFIVWSDVTVFNPITGDTYIQPWYHLFDDLMTPAQLRKQIAETVSTRYEVDANSVQLNRIYRRD